MSGDRIAGPIRGFAQLVFDIAAAQFDAVHAIVGAGVDPHIGAFRLDQFHDLVVVSFLCVHTATIFARSIPAARNTSSLVPSPK